MPMKNSISILYIGLFVDPKNIKKNIRTSADRIAGLFNKNNIATRVSSCKSGRLARLIDNLTDILKYRNSYQIVIVPLFGTWPSFIWQEIVSFFVKKLNKKLILTVNGGSIPARMEKDPKWFLKALKRADAIVCPSAYLLRYLKKYQLPALLIENVVQLDEYFFQEKRSFGPKIIWMRAFEDIYNPEMAIRVAILLARKYDDFKMVMAGADNGSLLAIRKMIKQYKLEENIILPGYICMEEKIALAREYDIYINTNKIDNAPVSVIEFMALGLPVVSVNSGGLPDLITDGYNGFLVNVDDDASMVARIEMLIQQPQTGTTIAKNAYNFSQRFDEKPVLEKWLKLFQKLKEKKSFAILKAIKRA